MSSLITFCYLCVQVGGCIQLLLLISALVIHSFTAVHFAPSSTIHSGLTVCEVFALHQYAHLSRRYSQISCSDADNVIYRRNLRGYEGNRCPTFWIGGTVPPLFRTQAKNLLLSEAIFGDWIYTKSVFSAGAPRLRPWALTPPENSRFVSVAKGGTFSPPQLVHPLFRPKLRAWCYLCILSCLSLAGSRNVSCVLDVVRICFRLVVCLSFKLFLYLWIVSFVCHLPGFVTGNACATQLFSFFDLFRVIIGTH